MSDIIDFDVVADEDPPEPPKRAGRPGVGEAAINAAREAGEKARKSRKKAPWVIVPKSRKPEVGTQAYYNLKNKFKEGSPHHKATGEHFEVVLAERVTNDKGTSKGVLWVRLGS